MTDYCKLLLLVRLRCLK